MRASGLHSTHGSYYLGGFAVARVGRGAFVIGSIPDATETMGGRRARCAPTSQLISLSPSSLYAASAGFLPSNAWWVRLSQRPALSSEPKTSAARLSS